MKIMTKALLPTIFVNHGGGPLPLLGKQPDIVKHFEHVRQILANKPKPTAIVVVSAHWDNNPIQITSAEHPKMYYDYYGFPPESYKYKYNAPGSPALSQKIYNTLKQNGIQSELNSNRGYDHGVFIPLMMIYPEADIPVVCVSLHTSMDAERHIQLGKALQIVRNENPGILILGSGYTFHNMNAFFHPTNESYQASANFNEWLKDTILRSKSHDDMLEKLKDWEKVPGARICHPTEEHLIPLLVIAAAAGASAGGNGNNDDETCKSLESKLIFNVDATNGQHAISSYMFE